MEDILGREIHDGSMCVYMGIGQYSHMHIGVFMGKSMYFLAGNTLCRGNYTTNMYLLENLSEAEIKIKNRILELIVKEREEREEERKRKSEMKTIPSSKLVVGGIYETIGGKRYVYLGNKTYTFEVENDRYNRYKCVKSGNCFSSLWSSDDISNISQNKIIRFEYFFNEDNPSTVIIVKTKKFVKLLGTVDISFPFIVEGKQQFGYSDNRNVKITIE